MSESNRGDNHVCSCIKCRGIAPRPPLPGPSVRIGRGRSGRVEGRSISPPSCPGPLLSLCVFGWAPGPREMRGSVCSAERVFWFCACAVERGSVCCVAPFPAAPRPGALNVGSRRTRFGRARPCLAVCRSVEQHMHHHQPARCSVSCLGVPGLVSDLACGGRPGRGLLWAGRARSWRARPGADSYPGYHHLLPPPGPQRPPARAAPSANRSRIRAFR